jgi:hypothetical protein
MANSNMQQGSGLQGRQGNDTPGIASQQVKERDPVTGEMKEQGIDRLISLITKSAEVESVAKAGNSEETVSVTFKDGEVLVFTLETSPAEEVI